MLTNKNPFFPLSASFGAGLSSVVARKTYEQQLCVLCAFAPWREKKGVNCAAGTGEWAGRDYTAAAISLRTNSSIIWAGVLWSAVAFVMR